MGGAVVARTSQLAQEFEWWANCLGVAGAPFDSYLTLRGVRTLSARMRVHEENAGEIADFLAQNQGGAYSAYLDIGSHKILSFSPELFVERRGNKLITRPMKGTFGRGQWLEEDCNRPEQLRASANARAENVIIVDLLRSDLGKIAEPGSVEVPELFAVERLCGALQMTSTVTAVQRPDITVVDILRALFPGGSVTGAPKARSMAIIKELEQQSRGIYTGAIGLLGPNGDAVFNVAIRTLVVDANTGAGTFGVGGGNTWESTTYGEYVSSILTAAPG